MYDFSKIRRHQRQAVRRSNLAFHYPMSKTIDINLISSYDTLFGTKLSILHLNTKHGTVMRQDHVSTDGPNDSSS